MEPEVARRWWDRIDALRPATPVVHRLAAALGRRPYHLSAVALALGLALAPSARAAVPIAAIFAGAAARVAARAAGSPTWPLSLLAATVLCVGGVAGAWRIDAIDRSAECAGPEGAYLFGRATLLEHPRPSP